MNEKLEALLKSIHHWVDVVAAPKAVRIGASSCALCKRGKARHIYASVMCMGCPVAERTGQYFCNGSPYHSFVLAKYRADDVHELRKLAVEELCFLVSLIPDCQSTDKVETETLLKPQRQDVWPRDGVALTLHNPDRGDY